MMAKRAETRKQFSKTQNAVIRVAEALLFLADPPLSRTQNEEKFILKSVLDELVWKYGESTHLGHRKYESSEHWSEKALAEFQKDSKKYVRSVVLEHVKPRAVLVDELMDAKDIHEVRRVFESVVTCVILRSEHPLVTKPATWRPSADGAWWERYEGVLVRVDGPRVAERGHLKKGT